jgi:hypothetical protein
MSAKRKEYQRVWASDKRRALRKKREIEKYFLFDSSDSDNEMSSDNGHSVNITVTPTYVEDTQNMPSNSSMPNTDLLFLRTCHCQMKTAGMQWI